MNANKVVPDGVERDHMSVIFDLFRERVGQPCEAAHLHSHGEIVPFDVGRAHVGRIRVALDPRLAGADALCRAVATLHAFRRCAVQLHQHGIVNVATESALNCLKVCLVAVAGELDAIGKARAKVVHQAHGAVAVAPANEIRNDQLRVGLNRRPGPSIAIGQVLPFRRCNVLLFRIGERPNFVHLNPSCLHVADRVIMEIGAYRSGFNQKLRHGVDRNVSNS